MLVLTILRVLVFAAFVVAVATLVGSWALRTYRLNQFGKTAQLIRRTSDPILRPVERWLVRRGGNPSNAEWWVLGGTVVGGIVVLTLAEWLIGQLAFVSRFGRGGPLAVIKLAFFYAGQVVTIALIVRVVGSWLGATRYTPLMRIVYKLTDWIVEPLRKIVPPIGPIDITPIVAWVLIQLVVSVVARL